MYKMHPLVLCALLLLLLALVVTIESHAAPKERRSVCRVTLFEDGSWSSPDYQVGEPWPPECKFRIVESKCGK